MFKFFKSHPLPTVEQWANQHKDKASADQIIASAIIQSFAKDFKHWQFVGEFAQRHSSRDKFKSASLSRKIPTKKHIVIDFLFEETDAGDTYSTIYKYKVIGCEVNGIQIDDSAFKAIITAWHNIAVQVRATEAAAEAAKKSQEVLDKKWNLAEDLIGMKRNRNGLLVPKKQAEEKPSIIEDMEMPL